MNLDVQVLSVDTDGDAPGIVWLKKNGFLSMSRGALAQYLEVDIETFGPGYSEFPDVRDHVIPENFVLAVPCPDEYKGDHYWVYRFHPNQRTAALLFKLTFGGI